MKKYFIAHHREHDLKEQTVCEHLRAVSLICRQLAEKIGAPQAGELLGVLHDFGKYSQQFQTYIQSATGMLNPDLDDYVDAKALKGKIDHSTAGAQWVWQRYHRYGVQGKLIGQILAVCLASHHGGLLDCLKPGGENGFSDRITKDKDKTHLQECLETADDEVLNKIGELATDEFLREFWNKLVLLVAPEKDESETVKQFRLGFFLRFLFSCLIDADRIDSADFENPGNVSFRPKLPVDWQIAIDRLEAKLASFPVRNEIDTARRGISDQCKKRADSSQGIYTLTVPTGGGKTFGSMRYALHHAKQHKLDHIIYIIPYTSIIEQNAGEIRKVLEREGDDPWVLEHHSNLEPETLTWHSKLVTENWDAPIIFTTMVQFLEVLFGSGTRGARRMHNIANSVLIFDEIQNLPVNCVHLFCNAIQFFVDHARSTALLCTATQPLLDDLKFGKDKGQLTLSDDHELVDDMTKVFEQFKRVEIKNLVCPEGWTEQALGELMLSQLKEKGNCLVIVNTKKWARKLYDICQSSVDKDSLFHLSTSLCPAHRKKIFKTVRQRLKDKLPVLCISTQLIEAGVDVDFNSVIRFLAGLDSIAQAAGRCNRNGKLDMAQVYVVNPQEEAIDMLADIKEGREKALRIFSEKDEGELLDPEVMSLYFSYYFYERAKLMAYPLREKKAGRRDTLLSLISDNHLNIVRTQPHQLRQAFKTAGKAFQAIDAPTQALIVPYADKGKEIIAGLCADFEPAKAFQLLKEAQKYSVNVFPNVWRQLKEAGAVRPVQEGEEIYYLDERYYSDDFGLSTEEVSTMQFQNV